MSSARVVALGLVLLSAVAETADACDRAWPVRQGLPRRSFARAVGIVSGYGVSPPALGALGGLPVLLLRADDVVSGAIPRGDVQVIAYITGRSCRRALATRADLERAYPIGMAVAVFGQARRAPQTAAGTVIVIEESRGQYVQPVPPYIVRTAAGDLDFERFDASQAGAWGFIEFEFDRAVLTLGRSRPRERLARVEQLAAYPGFARTPAARFMYRNLVVASGASEPERRRLTDAFDDRLRRR